MKLERGMLVSNGSLEWYIVVNVVYEDAQVYLQCICDNANNTYVFTPQEIEVYLSLDEIKKFSYTGWDNDREFPDHLMKRNIPYEEVLEIILGVQNMRFEK